MQVQVGDTRRAFFMNPPKSYRDLERAVSRKIPKTRAMEFGLMYENDEKEYVVMNSDTICLRIAISSSKCIEGTNVPRLKLRVFEDSFPSVKSSLSTSPSHPAKPQFMPVFIAKLCTTMKSREMRNNKAMRINSLK